jgi:putative SOS response-associated peptidase YedK
MPAVFPDWEAPVIRNTESKRELVKMRWGLPNPPQHGGINTNIRNPTSPHWRRWLKPENRCLVPANSFSEYNDKPNPASLTNPDGSKHAMAGKKDVVWFALDKSRPLFSFAGIWTEWSGARGTKDTPRIS